MVLDVERHNFRVWMGWFSDERNKWDTDEEEEWNTDFTGENG